VAYNGQVLEKTT